MFTLIPLYTSTPCRKANLLWWWLIVGEGKGEKNPLPVAGIEPGSPLAYEAGVYPMAPFRHDRCGSENSDNRRVCHKKASHSTIIAVRRRDARFFISYFKLTIHAPRWCTYLILFQLAGNVEDVSLEKMWQTHSCPKARFTCFAAKMCPKWKKFCTPKKQSYKKKKRPNSAEEFFMQCLLLRPIYAGQ